MVKEDTKHPTYNKWTRTDLIGYILLRNCLLKHVIEGKRKRVEKMRKKN